MPNSTQISTKQISHTLNCRGRLLSLEKPKVMGILNLTPDSFSDGGKFTETAKAIDHAGRMLEEGAEILDIGGYSSRPGADEVSPEEEIDRIGATTEAIMQAFPEAIISIDTFRAGVARQMLDAGAHIINDISGGNADAQMFTTVGAYDVPYVMMHMKGTPATMQKKPQYDDLMGEIHAYFVRQLRLAMQAGIKDILLDPGFGFGKTLAHNYEIYRNLGNFEVFGMPLLIGISRKSMIYRLFDTEPGNVLELSTALHFKSLDFGVKILRVHDVQPAVRAVQMHHYLHNGTI